MISAAEIPQSLPPDVRRAMIALRTSDPNAIATARRDEAERRLTSAPPKEEVAKAEGTGAAKRAQPTKAPSKPRPRIDPSVIVAIREAHAAGATQGELAERFGIGRGSVWRALRERTA